MAAVLFLAEFGGFLLIVAVTADRWQEFPHDVSSMMTPADTSETSVAVAIEVSVSVPCIAFRMSLAIRSGATSALILVVFVLVSVARIVLKIREPKPAGIKLVPLWMPAAGAVTAATLLTGQMFMY